MTRYRILHLINTPHRRGSELFAMRLAEHLQGRRFENRLCALYAPSFNSNGAPAAGVTTLALGARRGHLERALRFSPQVVWRLGKVLREFSPNIVVAHGTTTLKYGSLAKLLSGRIVTVYINIGMASFWADSLLKMRFNRALLRGIDTVVSVSQKTRTDFLRLYGFPSERAVFIPNAVDTGEFVPVKPQTAAPEVRGELGLCNGEPTIVTVGSLSREKNQADLLRVVAGLRASGLGTHLLAVGDGPLRSKLEQQSGELGISDHVHFLGTRSDVPSILATADLFALPSKTEGMPAVLIEAGLAGLASVSYNVGGVAEVVEHGVTGLLVAPGDFQGLLQAVAALCHDPRRRAAMGEAARRRCQELFDIRKVAQAYQALLLQLVASGVRDEDGRSKENTLAD